MTESKIRASREQHTPGQAIGQQVSYSNFPTGIWPGRVITRWYSEANHHKTQTPYRPLDLQT